MGVGGLGWEFLLEMGRKPGMGERGGYIMGHGKFLNSLYIVGRGVVTPYFLKTPYIGYPHFSNFVHPFHFPFTSNPIPTALSVVLFLWLNVVITPHLICYFT